MTFEIIGAQMPRCLLGYVAASFSRGPAIVADQAFVYSGIRSCKYSIFKGVCPLTYFGSSLSAREDAFNNALHSILY